MKKILLSLLLFSPLLTLAQGETEGSSNDIMAIAILVLGMGLIMATALMAIARASYRKNEILNSNLERIKMELANKGHEPVQALINILHKESELYKEPEPMIVKVLEKEGELKDDEIVQALAQDAAAAANESNEPDHSLALKVADELVRIQKNLSQMDESVKGLKQLNASVDRIANNFLANGYELVNMLNKPYNEGMKVQANFIPNEDLKSGEQIITRIIKPQVNFNGEMIQTAQIEVSIGE